MQGFPSTSMTRVTNNPKSKARHQGMERVRTRSLGGLERQHETRGGAPKVNNNTEAEKLIRVRKRVSKVETK